MKTCMLYRRALLCLLLAPFTYTIATAQTFTTNVNGDFNNVNTFAWRLGRVSIGQNLVAAPPVNNDFKLRVFGGSFAQVQNGVFGTFAAGNQWTGLGQNPVVAGIYGSATFRDDRYNFYSLENTTRNAVATKDLVIGAGTTANTYDANQRILIKGYFSPAGTNSRILGSFNPGAGAFGVNEENPASTFFVNATNGASSSAFRSMFILNNGTVATTAGVLASTFSALGQEGNALLNLNSHGLRVQAGNVGATAGLIAANFTVNTTNQFPFQQQEAEIQWQDLNYAGAVTGAFTGVANDRLSFYFRNNVSNVNTRRRVMTMIGGAHVGINVAAGAPVVNAGVNPLQAGNVFNVIRLQVSQGSILAEGYYSVSDSSLKTNIKDIADPIGLLSQVRPRKYDFRAKGAEDSTTLVPQYGFIAQELAQTRVGEVVAKMDDGLYAVQYDQIIPILTAGMKVQQAVITKQAEQLAAMKETMDKQAVQVEALNRWVLQLSEKLGVEPPAGTTSANPAGRSATAVVPADANNPATGSRLLQNSPNPSNGYTEIFYNLAEGATGAINVIDQQGRISKTFSNLPKGLGKVVINRGDLQPGTYTYTLLANGQLAGSKQLVIVR